MITTLLFAIFSLIVLILLISFRRQLRHIRRQLHQKSAPAIVAKAPVPVAKSKPDEPEHNIIRKAASTMAALLILAVAFTIFQFGGHVRERALTGAGEKPELAAGDTVQESQLRTSSPASIDCKLAELRERPTLENVSWFDSAPIDPARRNEVAAELGKIARGSNKSAASLAGQALKRWGRASEH